MTTSERHGLEPVNSGGEERRGGETDYRDRLDLDSVRAVSAQRDLRKCDNMSYLKSATA